MQRVWLVCGLILLAAAGGLYLFDRARPRVELTLEFDSAPEQLDVALDQAVVVLRNRLAATWPRAVYVSREGKTRVLAHLVGFDEAEIDRITRIIQETGKLEMLIATDDQEHLDGLRIPGTRIVKMAAGQRDDGSAREMRVKNEPNHLGECICAAEATLGKEGWEVFLRFDEMGRKRFAELTSQNVHRKLGIIYDGELVSTPVIREPIPSGTARISGSFTESQTKDLAVILRSGALPAPMRVVWSRRLR